MLSTKIFLEVEKTSSFWTVMWICASQNEIESTHLWKKMKSLQFIPIHNSKAKMDKSMIWITNRYWVIMYKEWIGMAMGRVLDETPLSHSHPKIYNYFPSPPKPRARWGMHSHPNFETTIKIPSAPCLDSGMIFWRNEIRNQRIKILDM